MRAEPRNALLKNCGITLLVLGTLGSLEQDYRNPMTSYMIRANYGFMDKYLLTASMRWDGASQLAPGHKWASFPYGIGMAYWSGKFHEKTLTGYQLKLRLGFGVTGVLQSAYATKGPL